MNRHIILVDDVRQWNSDYPDYSVVSVRDYLTSPGYSGKRRLKIINLCRDLTYHSLGYYASLLAEARGHRMIPSVRTLQDLSAHNLYASVTDGLQSRVNTAFTQQPQPPEVTSLEIIACFGQCQNAAFQPITRRLYEAFPMPLLRVEFQYRHGWKIHRLKPIHPGRLTDDQKAYFFETLQQKSGRRWHQPPGMRESRFDLCILYNPDEKMPPSDRQALARFIRAARKLNMSAELITPNDLGKLENYDGLFIRETTAINDHTYRFARHAANKGLVVIDDPDSILRCVNKIYLSELLTTNDVPIPASVILAKNELDKAEKKLGYPMILKIPDGSFSRGMHKVKNREELNAGAADLFQHSELIIAQAYTYTEFDWRVGVLNGEPLYVCRYYMSRGHWQIYNHSSGKTQSGKWDTLTIEEAPQDVVAVAVRAANLIGKGLYGVDLKQTEKGIFVIEVNDNPSVESGVEDKVLGKVLYEKIMGEFLRRLERRAGNGPATASRSD